MMKISEMYRRSGGTHASEKCGDCCNLEMIKNGKSTTYVCSRYDGCTSWWKTYPACGWFNQRPQEIKKSKSEEDVPGQMSIFDYPGMMPRKEQGNDYSKAE